MAKVKFLRIVLDEGHIIRNPNALHTKAVINLKAQRRWILTGRFSGFYLVVYVTWQASFWEVPALSKPFCTVVMIGSKVEIVFI